MILQEQVPSRLAQQLLPRTDRAGGNSSLVSAQRSRGRGIPRSTDKVRSCVARRLACLCRGRSRRIPAPGLTDEAMQLLEEFQVQDRRAPVRCRT